MSHPNSYINKSKLILINKTHTKITNYNRSHHKVQKTHLLKDHIFSNLHTLIVRLMLRCSQWTSGIIFLLTKLQQSINIRGERPKTTTLYIVTHRDQKFHNHANWNSTITTTNSQFTHNILVAIQIHILHTSTYKYIYIYMYFKICTQKKKLTNSIQMLTCCRDEAGEGSLSSAFHSRSI